ncbi:MAG: carboxypeptidase PM20D1 [Planctomycetota bacterium]|jgi:carboxypeptidase PM20D1
MKRVLLLVALLLSIGIAVTLIRSTQSSSRQLSSAQRRELADALDVFAVDANAAALRLAAAIQIPTVSDTDWSAASRARFEQLHALLETFYPLAWSELTIEVIREGSLLLHWVGEDPALEPVLLMAHLDVVPIEAETESQWEHAPFSGAIADGKVWGRGALDDKGAALAWFEAIESMLAAGVRPQRDTWFAMGHDEEIGGHQGNGMIAALLAQRGLRFAFVLDEGGFSTQGLVPLTDGPLALIGVAEKGWMTVRLQATAPGGHSSVPEHPTAIERVAAAIARVEQALFPPRIDGATHAFLEWLAPETDFATRCVLSNLWWSESIVTSMLGQNAKTAAMIQTTYATTTIQGGVRENVLPSFAQAAINLRLLPGDSVPSTLETLRDAIDDDLIELVLDKDAREASAVSSVDCGAFQLLQRSIACIAPEAIVAPYLVVGGTDSIHYRALSDRIYRFQPYRLTAGDVGRFHGPNEFVAIEQHADVIRFCQLVLGGLGRELLASPTVLR